MVELTQDPSAARDFIDKCLVIDQKRRLTASQALAHPWLAHPSESASPETQAQRPDLLPSLRKNFNAKGTWKRAIMGVRAASALKAGGEARRATMMAEMDLGEEDQQRMREQAQLAKRDAEEEAVSRAAGSPRLSHVEGAVVQSWTCFADPRRSMTFSPGPRRQYLGVRIPVKKGADRSGVPRARREVVRGGNIRRRHGLRLRAFSSGLSSLLIPTVTPT